MLLEQPFLGDSVATNVNVIYNLTDRISSKADRIQRRVEKLEKTLANVDKLTSDLGRNKGLETYSRKGVAATDRLNARLATSEKKLKAVTSATEKATKKTDLFTKAVDKSSDALIKHNKHLEDLNSWHKQGASNAAVHTAQLREFGNELTKVSRKVNTQVKSLGALDKAAHALEGSLDGLILKENKLGDAMARKNIHAREQVRVLGEVDRSTERATRSQQKYNREMGNMDKLRSKWSEQMTKDGTFMQGVDLGIFQFEALRKVAAILPVIGVGFGGIASMAGGATVAVGGLIGSITRLSGAMALLPGMYASVGLLAGAFKGVQANIFKPALEGSKALTDIDKQIKSAQQAMNSAKASNASSGSASSIAAVENAESDLNALYKERDKLAKDMPKHAQKLVDATENIKNAWRDAWFSGDNAETSIKAATDSIERAMKVLKSNQWVIDGLVDLFVEMADVGQRLSRNPFFSGMLKKSLAETFDNSSKVLGIVENMATVTAGIAYNMSLVTGEVLDSVGAWSEAYTKADKIEQTVLSTRKWMREGADSLKLWVGSLRDIGAALVTITDPMGVEFDKRLEDLSGRFRKWADKIEADGSLEAFNANSWKVLDAFGRVLLSVGGVIGKIGADPKAAKATADFLDVLGGGIESFGSFALRSMKEVGPEMIKFFKNFGEAMDGSSPIIIETQKTLLEFGNKFLEFINDIPGTQKIFGVSVSLLMISTAVGAFTGSILGVAGNVARTLDRITTTVSGIGRKLSTLSDSLSRFLSNLRGLKVPTTPKVPKNVGGVAKAFGKLGGFLNGVADLTAQNVHVTNTLGSPIPVIVVGGGGAIPGPAGALGGLTAGAVMPIVLGVLATTAIVAAAYAIYKGMGAYRDTDKSFNDRAIDQAKRDAQGDKPDGGKFLWQKDGELKYTTPNKSYKFPGEKGYKPKVPSTEAMGEGALGPQSIAASEHEKLFRKIQGQGGDRAAEALAARTRHLGVAGTQAFVESANGVRFMADVVGVQLPEAYRDGFVDATTATKRGASTLASETDKAGQAAWAPLDMWTRRVQQTMGTLGAPASIMTGGGTSGTAPRLPGGAQGPVPPARAGDSNKPVAGGSGKTGGLAASMGPAVAMANRLGGTITSGFRPGAVTSSGNMSDHSTGNAIDIGGPPALMAQIAMAANALPGVKQVIYSPVGWSRDGGAFSPVTDAAVKADHYDHVHVAMGGKGAGGGGGGMAGLPPLPGFPGTVFGQAVGGLASQAHAFLSSQMGTGGDPTSMGASGGSMQAIIQQAAGAYGANASGLLAVANAESSFNPTVSNNWDSNALAGTPSKGLFQFIESTFNSMSTQAMSANPSAWTGVNRTWMDPMAQALTAAWAFTHGQGSHWATASRYGTGDSNAPAVNVSGGSARRSAGSRGGARRSAPRRTAGGGSVFHTTVVVQGALFLNEEGRAQLGDMVGKHVAAQVIKASPNAATETDI